MLTIALGQIEVRTGKRAENLVRAAALACEASGAGADVLLLPELWLDGYDLERAAEWASPLGEGGFAHMASLARTYRLYVVGSVLESHQAGISNTAALYAPDGTLLGSYRKVHLFRPMNEHLHLKAGHQLTLCQSPWGPVGLAICYDLRFPELFRALALGGAVLILLPAQWPSSRIEAWTFLTRARAAENQVFLAACNRIGEESDTTFPGHSLIVDPWGRILAQGDDQERLVLAQVDLAEIQKARHCLPILEDRRPEAYHIGLCL